MKACGRCVNCVLWPGPAGAGGEVKLADFLVI